MKNYLSGKLAILFLIPVISLPVLLAQGEKVNFVEMSKGLGYKATVHEVVTLDGYILKVYHLKGNRTTDRKYPVLLMHGISDTAISWILRGDSSLAITLVKAGYDVWLGNTRGNMYTRKHVDLDPDIDPAFWNFTFHEHGLYDLPEIIDLVLIKTGAEKINMIGHSQGTTIAYVLGSLRPEYNEKINIMISLAPVAYLHNVDSPLSLLFKVMPTLSIIFDQLNVQEMFSEKSDLVNFLRNICSLPHIGYMICVENFLFVISGADYEEVKPDFYYLLNIYFPNSTSRKNVEHYAQLHNRKKFAQFDYGAIGNKIKYNSSEPPVYDLSKVTMPVALIVGLNDKLSTVKDVDVLKAELVNLVNYTVSPRKTFNHMDDMWGENMKIYLFPYILDILEKYNKFNINRL